MLSNFELEDLAIQYRIDNFNVISKDEVKDIKKIKAGNYVLNMENERDDKGEINNGSHWISMFISPYFECFYFDSFGFQAPQAVMKFMKKSNKKICYNNRQIQDICSQMCGWFCLAFLRHMNNKPIRKSYVDWYEEFIDGFNDNTKSNDNLLKRLF